MQFLNAFYRHERGGIGIIVGVAAMVLVFGILALTIDLNRVQTLSMDNQGSVDAAALAAADFVLKHKMEEFRKTRNESAFNSVPNSDLIYEHAKQAYMNNAGGDGSQKAAHDITAFSVNYNESLKRADVNVCTKLPYEKLAGVTNADNHSAACNSASAAFGQINNANSLEVAFAIEISSTMLYEVMGGYAGSTNLQFANAFHATINDYRSFFENSDSYISIVPYYYYTHFAPYSQFSTAPGTPPPLAGNARFNEPLYNMILTWPEVDSLYTDAVLTPGGANTIYDGATKYPHQNVRFVDDAAIYVQPLTNQFSIAYGIFTKMLPARCAVRCESYPSTPKTSGLVGIINAWLTLDPAYRGVWNKRSAYETMAWLLTGEHAAARDKLPRDFDKTKKFIVHIVAQDDQYDYLDTDNISYNPKNDTENTAYYKKVCDGIKAKGVEIYVLFVRDNFAPRNRTEALPYHKVCASTPDHFRDVNVGRDTVRKEEFRKQLTYVMDDIKSKAGSSTLTGVRLVK